MRVSEVISVNSAKVPTSSPNTSDELSFARTVLLRRK